MSAEEDFKRAFIASCEEEIFGKPTKESRQKHADALNETAYAFARELEANHD